MNQVRRPIVIRAAAAAFAVLATTAAFNAVVSLSEPQRSVLVASTQARQASHVVESSSPVAKQAILLAGSVR